MKFLISHEYPFHRLGYGGGHSIVRGLARELTRLGHEVHVCSTGRDELGVAAADAPVRYHLSGHYNKYTSGLETLGQILVLTPKLRPDWVCCLTSEAFGGFWFCKQAGVKTAFYACAPLLHHFFIGHWPALRIIRNNLGLFLSFLGARSSKRFLTISDYANRQSRANWHIEESRIFTVGAGIKEEFMAAGAQKGTLLRNGLRLISVGRLAMSQKPLDLVAEALAGLQTPWLRWTIVGSGVDEQELRERVIELGIEDKTVFIGMQDSAQVAALLDEHDIALLPSNYESFFLTVYEAAARGKIVVTNDVADIRDYFADSASVVVAERATPESYRQAIGYAIENFDRLQSNAGGTAERVKRDYNWSTVAERFLQALT